MMRYRSIFLVVSFILIISGCLDTNFDEPNTQFILSTSLDDNEDVFSVGEDEVRVISVRYVIDNIEVEATDDNERFDSSPTYISLTNLNLDNKISIGSGEIFGGSYTGVSYDLILPPNDSSIEDEELIERNENGDIVRRYSFVISGIYNSIGFIIKSQETTRVTYSFDRNINLPQTSGVLDVNLRAEWKEWFLDENREELLNPNNETDVEQIKENFKRFFTAQAITAGEL